MSEESKTDVVTDEVVAHQEDTDTTQVSQAVEPAESESLKKDQEYNWRRMREAMEDMQQRNRLLEERLNETYNKKNSEEDDFSEIDKLPDDELLTKGQTKKLAMQAARKAAQDAAAEIAKKRDLDTLDDRVRLKYPDYGAVVSSENLEELKNDPLFVKSLKGLADPYDQACFVYEQLKLRGIKPELALEKKQLEHNAAKPRSQQSLGGASPLHSANAYATWPDAALQKQLYQEMIDAAKGA
jgi:hypothetical protein